MVFFDKNVNIFRIRYDTKPKLPLRGKRFGSIHRRPSRPYIPMKTLLRVEGGKFFGISLVLLIMITLK